MPRTKLGEIYSKPKRLRPNYWHTLAPGKGSVEGSVGWFTSGESNRLQGGLVKAAYKARGWTSAELAQAVGENESTTRGRINKQPSMWKISDIYKYCDALNIDRDEAFAVILKSG